MPRRIHDPARRLARTRVKLALIGAGGALVGVAAIAALLAEDRPLPVGVRVDSLAQLSPERDSAPAVPSRAAPLPASVAPEPSASPSLAVASAPAKFGEVLDPRSRPDAASLAAWVQDGALAPNVRYAALRRLEAEHPTSAVSTAIAVLDDTCSLVRLNALAVLARSQDPRAAEALARTDARSQRLAQNLLARR